MTRPAFVRQWQGARADRVISATSEAGRIVGTPVTSAAALGRLRLRSSGTSTEDVALDLRLDRGGNATGYADPFHGAPGAAVIYRETGGAADAWHGYTPPVYLDYAQTLGMGSGSADFPGIATPRTLADGRLCSVRAKRTGTAEVEFIHKTYRHGPWTAVSVTTAREADSAPALIVLPSGRLICYYVRLSGSVGAHYSDDDGATWAVWSTDTLAVAGAGYMLAAELVGDQVLLIASTQPGTASGDARVYWSFDGGQSFGLAATETWGPARTCVTKTGQALVITTDQASTNALLYYVPPGGAPGLVSTESFAMTADADDPVLALVCMDDGTIWALGAGNLQPAPRLEAQYSRDHGVTWQAAFSTTASSTSTIWRLGINEATPYGFRTIAAGEWNGRMVVLGVTDVPTGTRDDALVEMHFGGWDRLTLTPWTEREDEPNGLGGTTGALLMIDTPNQFGWTKTDVGAGATVTVTDDGLHLVANGTDNSSYEPPTQFFPTGTTGTWRMRYTVTVDADGSVADDRAIVRFRPRSGAGPDYAGLRIRHATDQIRVVDSTGTLATTVSVANRFTYKHEVLVFVDASASTPKLSVYIRAIDAALPGTLTGEWTEVLADQALGEVAGTPSGPLIGGVDAGAVEWTIGHLEVSVGDMGFSGGFTNPDDLTGRSVEAAYDVAVVDGVRVGATGGAGVRSDDYTLATTATYAAAWIWRDMRPSAHHRSTGDGVEHAVVFDAGASTTIPLSWAGLIGTNFRTATVQLHTADSWGAPSVSMTMDATLYAGKVTAIKSGLGYVGVDGMPWAPHQWRSAPGARMFVEVGGVVYEVDDNDEDRLYVDGVDFSAASGTLYVFGDRMGAKLPAAVRYRYARALIAAQDTSDGHYRLGTLWAGITEELLIPYANGFTWSDVDNTQEQTTEAGYGVRFVAGPMRRELRIAWDSIDRLTSAQVAWLRSLWRALRGRYEPVALVDLDKPGAWGLYTLTGPLAVENVYGEERDALERVSQIVLRQVL